MLFSRVFTIASAVFTLGATAVVAKPVPEANAVIAKRDNADIQTVLTTLQTALAPALSGEPSLSRLERFSNA